MSNKVTFDYSKAASFISGHEVEFMKKLALDAKEVLVSKTGAGNDFLGWIDLPVDYDKDEFARIKSGGKDSGRFGCSACNWYWRLLSRSEGSYRVFEA